MWLSGKNIFLQNFLFKSFFLAYLRWLLRDKYLKNLILHATKESSNLGIYGLPSGILESGSMSEGAIPFPLKIFNIKVSFNLTSGECFNQLYSTAACWFIDSTLNDQAIIAWFTSTRDLILWYEYEYPEIYRQKVALIHSVL